MLNDRRKMIEEGERMKLLRKTMGMKQQVITDRFGYSQGHISRMELGAEKLKSEVEKFVVSEFIKYRKKEIKRLEEQIVYLNSLN